MTTMAPAHLMTSRSRDDAHRHQHAASRSWQSAVGDAASFALVGVAAFGFVVESLDMMTDDLRGIAGATAGAFVGAVGSAVYQRVERRAERLARARDIAWTIVRFFVAFQMVRYGVAKLVGMQFYPRYYRLDSRAADLSPMALAWTFFGRSYGYQAVAGAFEVASAVLLCFRRTSLLGACLLLPVMGNIVLMDFFYDVPVRLFSSLYFVMAVYVLAPDAKRFVAFFLSDGAVPARSRRAERAPSSMKRMATVFVIALALLLPSADIVHKAYQRGIFRHDPLEGSWTVERIDGMSVNEGGPKWEKLYFEKGGYGFIRTPSGREPFKLDVDERSRTIRLFEIGNGSSELTGTYQLDVRALLIHGAREGSPYTIVLVRDLPR